MKESSNEPGPGRSTSDSAFNDLRKQIAQRNDAAHKAARKARIPEDQRKVAKRRKLDD
ncbi:MAG TPA: hypothetical protein VIL64_02315 [Solirubrobacteraceae bacterium]|jgi:hypothetical protein